jgi:type III pantothenate kinase
MNSSIEYYLTIDQGNTSTKCALHSIDKSIITKFELDKLTDIITIYNLNNTNTLSIKTSVTKKEESIALNFLDVKSLLKNNHFLDMPVHYNETIGLDRLVAAYFGFIQSEKSFLIIDTGTFTTIDNVDAKGFNGGYILPGLKALENSYSKGSLLSVPNSSETKLSFSFPNTTEKAINQGALLSFLAPIKEVVAMAKPSNILITGGNGNILYSYLNKDKLLSTKELTLLPDLLHNSLAKIAAIQMKSQKV